MILNQRTTKIQFLDHKKQAVEATTFFVNSVSAFRENETLRSSCYPI
jgi:hypothetical protein